MTSMDVDIDFPVPFHCPQLAPMSINGWDYSGVPELVSLPDGMTSDDVEELKSDLRVVHAATSPVDRERCIRQLALAWEDYFLPKYPVPFFEVRVADVRAVGGSLSTALQLYDEVLHSINGKSMASFSKFVATVRNQAQGDAEQQARKSGSLSFFQTWKPAREHANPFSWPMLPPGTQEIQAAWRANMHQRHYLNYNWIQTNHMEQTFMLTPESVHAITQHGFLPLAVECLPESALKDEMAIAHTLEDLDEAYMDILQILDKVELLTTETLKRIHSKMMKTSKVKIQDGCTSLHYINAGCTRQTSQRTVVVRSQQYNLAFCPAERVDQQLDYICKMGRQYIARWRNPFATAAWLHVTFVRCHPFDDGNGRMSRLISSIPLLRHGLPPLCITPASKSTYYDSMNVAWEGDFQPLINCFAESMRASMTEVENIMSS